MNGILRPSEKLHVIEMKFEGDVPQKDRCAQSYGTFVLCKDVYNARKIIKTAWNKETSTLRVIIDLRPYNVRPKRPAQFSFSIQINDSCHKPCSALKSEFGNVSTFDCTEGLCWFKRPGCDKCYLCSGECENERIRQTKFCYGRCYSNNN